MKSTSYISGTRIKSGQVNTTPRGSSFVFIIKSLLLGEFFLFLVLLTIWLWQQSLVLPAYLLGMLAIPAVFIGLFVLRALRLHTKKASPVSPKVLAALIYALQRDPNARVRTKAAMGLAELEFEEASHHHRHNELDNILISALERDPDPLVRSKAAVGLAELEFEEASYRHEHSKLEEILFEEGP